MSIPETLISSEVVYKGKIFDIKRDRVKTSFGNEATRDVLVHKGATAAVVVTHKNTILLVKQYRHSAEDFLLEIPAGGLEDGENPSDCIIRELQEEVGVKPNKIEFLYQIWLAPGYSSEKLFVYLATDLEKSILPHDQDEDLEVVELTFDEVIEMIVSGKIRDAKTIAAVLTVDKILNSKK